MEAYRTVPEHASNHRQRAYSSQRSQQQQQHHYHLIQSPYKVPVLPPLHPPEERARGSEDRATRSPISGPMPHIPSKSESQDPQSAMSSPMPLKQWPYVQSMDPSHPWDPSLSIPGNNGAVAYHPVQQPSTHGFDLQARQQSRSPAPIYDPRQGSVSTADSSGTGREDEVKDKKKQSKLTAKFKAKVKDLFARDEHIEPVPALRRRRRPSNPWDDEDY